MMKVYMYFLSVQHVILCTKCPQEFANTEENDTGIEKGILFHINLTTIIFSVLDNVKPSKTNPKGKRKQTSKPKKNQKSGTRIAIQYYLIIYIHS